MRIRIGLLKSMLLIIGATHRHQQQIIACNWCVSRDGTPRRPHLRSTYAYNGGRPEAVVSFRLLPTW